MYKTRIMKPSSWISIQKSTIQNFQPYEIPKVNISRRATTTSYGIVITIQASLARKPIIRLSYSSQRFPGRSSPKISHSSFSCVYTSPALILPKHRLVGWRRGIAFFGSFLRSRISKQPRERAATIAAPRHCATLALYIYIPEILIPRVLHASNFIQKRAFLMRRGAVGVCVYSYRG